jgi:hypothetical protein
LREISMFIGLLTLKAYAQRHRKRVLMPRV